jgi:DNA mismatch repair protein MutS2
VVAAARDRVQPERLRVAELLAEAQLAEQAAASERRTAADERAEAERVRERATKREAELEREIGRIRASAERERAKAVAQADADLAAARTELQALRDEIRSARRREKEVRRTTPAAAARAERERDRRLGAATARSERAEHALRALDEPLPLLAPLAVGDPVEAPAIGVRGTIAAIDGDEAEVVGVGGHRVRIALARLRPSAQEMRREEEPPAVRVVAAARSDVSDELDVRGQRAQEAREAVRAFVDDAALAGIANVRVVHGRGTGAVRKAVRDELAAHPLVEGQESDSADGATVAQLHV